MAKRFIVLGMAIAIVCGLALSGCSSSSSGSSKSASGSEGAASSSVAAQEQPAEPTLGSTIEFDDLSIQLGEGIETTQFSNQFSEHDGETVVVLPVSITNNSGEAKGLNMFYVKEFGSKGTELDSVFTYFDNDVRMMGEARSGATLTGSLCFLYDGNGDYYLTFNNFRNKIEVKVPVAI